MPEQLNKQHHTHRRWKKMVQLIKRHYSSSSMDNSDVIIITHQHPVTALRFHQCKIIIDRWNNSARTVVETGHTRKNNVRVLRRFNQRGASSSGSDGRSAPSSSFTHRQRYNMHKQESKPVHFVEQRDKFGNNNTHSNDDDNGIQNTFSQQARVLLNHRASQCTWTINP